MFNIQIKMKEYLAVVTEKGMFFWFIKSYQRLLKSKYPMCSKQSIVSNTNSLQLSIHTIKPNRGYCLIYNSWPFNSQDLIVNSPFLSIMFSSFPLKVNFAFKRKPSACGRQGKETKLCMKPRWTLHILKAKRPKS